MEFSLTISIGTLTLDEGLFIDNIYRYSNIGWWTFHWQYLYLKTAVLLSWDVDIFWRAEIFLRALWHYFKNILFHFMKKIDVHKIQNDFLLPPSPKCILYDLLFFFESVTISRKMLKLLFDIFALTINFCNELVT